MSRNNQLVTNFYNPVGNEYSWAVSDTKLTGGGVIPMLYGAMRVTLPTEQIVGMYVDSGTLTNTLNILYALAMWRIDSVTDIRINGDAITEYPDIPTPVISYGTNQQPVIQAFAAIKNTTAIGEALTTSFVPHTTVNNVTGFGVGFSFPEGLYKTSSENYYPTFVYLQVQYKLHTDSVWKNLVFNESIPTPNATDRWSAGFWGHDPTTGAAIWCEIEAGSTTLTDHTYGDKYDPGANYWSTSTYINYTNHRPITMWIWISAGTVIVPYGGTENSYVKFDEYLDAGTVFAYYKDQLPLGKYDVQAKFYQAPHADDGTYTYHEDVTFEYLREYSEDDFRYPNVSLLAFQSIPTEKLSGGTPTIDALLTKSNVYVYNPVLAVYQDKSATNPAWAAYDVLHQAQYLEKADGTFEIAAYGVPHTKLDPYWLDWSGWADWCDWDGTAPYADKLPYTCNFYFNSMSCVQDILDSISMGGRAKVRQVGVNFKPIYEHPEPTVVQRFLFSHGNILRDSFSETISVNPDRPNLIEVSYQDPDNYYETATVHVPADDYDTHATETKIASVTLPGCCDRDMAIAYGMYQHNCNRYLTATSEWSANIDSIHCQAGDIVEAPAEFGGRLLAGSTDAVLILDQEVAFVGGVDYQIIINHQDDDTREVCDVVTAVKVADFVAGASSKLLLEDGTEFLLEDGGNFILESSAFDPAFLPEYYNGTMIVTVTGLTRAPDEFTRYVYGETGQVARLRRIISITTDSEFTRRIVAKEFNSAIFEDAAVIPVSPFNPYRRRTIPPPLDSVTLELIWKLDNTSKTWIPYIKATFIPDSTFDYSSLYSPVVTGRIYAHADTDPVSMSSKRYETVIDWKQSIFETPAQPFNGYTIYVTAALVNANGLEGSKCTPAQLTIDTSFTPKTTTSNVSVESYDYTNFGTNYCAYISWVPYGWELVDGKYTPILRWNSGSNYYVFSDYLVAWGLVNNTGDIPLPAQMIWFATADIGNIFNADGSMITDADQLDDICRAAATAGVVNGYTSQWVALTVCPRMKNGSFGILDFSQAETGYGLDWEWIQVTCPGGTGSTVQDVQIQNAELVYTMISGMNFLNEINWDYTLSSPAIDGFAFILRVQANLWEWETLSSIADTVTNVSTIQAAINTSTRGGVTSAIDFSARYAEWYSKGIPYFYMAFVDAAAYEIFKVDTLKVSSDPAHAVTRGQEGTTARTWGAGTIISYVPCEQIDTFVTEVDTTMRSKLCNPPVPINYAIHASLCAYKLITESPGYLRCNLALFSAVENRL